MMLNYNGRILVLIMGVMFLYGCTSAKGVEVRRYVDIKDRVDQNMEEGNAGYLGGTPQPEDRSDIRKTRKIYVVEVSQGDLEEEVVVESGPFEETEDTTDEPDNTIEVSKESAEQPSSLVFEPYDEDTGDDQEPRETQPQSSSVEYTVAKDDTLQKISKKFYDSYSKWPRIYDANRGVIDNPDSIKPGIVIRIPMD